MELSAFFEIVWIATINFKILIVSQLSALLKDFATPSLNMSEESPSRAVIKGGQKDTTDSVKQDEPVELHAFQLRRRWESR